MEQHFTLFVIQFLYGMIFYVIIYIDIFVFVFFGRDNCVGHSMACVANRKIFAVPKYLFSEKKTPKGDID